MPETTAHLSVRVRQNVRNRMKAIAAQRGEKLQDLIAALIEGFLAEAERQPPLLAEVVRSLREQETRLRANAVAALWVFGSVARGDAGPDSDVDLAIEFGPGTEASLLDIARLKLDLEDVLRHQVDLGERSAMGPRIATAAERDWVRIF